MAAFFILHLLKTNYMDLLQDDILSDEQELKIDEETSGYLIETSRWSKFIAITILALTAIFCLILIFFWKFVIGAMNLSLWYYRWSQSNLILLIAALAILIASVVVAYYYLINFSGKIKTGIETENMETVNEGLKSLKIHFIIIGVLIGIKILYTFYKMLT